MLQDFKLTDSGDLYLDSAGYAQVISGAELINQYIKNALLLLKTAWIYDITKGVPWLDILGRGYSKETIIQEVSSVIMALGVINRIIDVTLTVDNTTGIAKITWQVEVSNTVITGYISA